jgi:uncharacterized protein (DUF58 family)
MITRRGQFFLLVSLACLVVGLVIDRMAVVSLGLFGITWLGLEWIRLAWEYRSALRHVRFRRDMERQPLGTKALVAGRTASIQTTVEYRSWIPLSRVSLLERHPDQGVVEGESRYDGPLSREQSVAWNTTVMSSSAGILRWEGVRLELKDRHGFFFVWTFLRQPEEVQVLPPLADLKSGTVGRKRINALPMQGLHRHRRPGSGSELLDLRDYRDGDPPRSIAWKLSARRDRLITKEYESETPVRCTIVLDASTAMRFGSPGMSPFDRLTSLSASLARRLIEIRDPVGLTVIDESRTSILQPGSGRRHLYKIYSRLAEAAAQQSEPKQAPSSAAVESAFRFCQEVYPDLLDPRRNSVRGVGLGWWQLLRVLFLYVLLFACAGAGTIGTMIFFRGDAPFLFRLTGLLVFPISVILSFWLVRILLNMHGRSTFADARQAKQLAAIIAARHHLGPGGISWLQHDAGALSAGAMRFLMEHRVPFSPPLFDSAGNYVILDPQKGDRLQRILLRAAAHGRDDEFFVLMIDVLSIGDRWNDVMLALRSLRARRHQVAVVFPWPDALPPPSDAAWTNAAFAAADPLTLDDKALHRLVRLLDLKEYHRAFVRVKRELDRMRIPVICMTEQDAIIQLLDRVERLRHARSWP